jgi:integrase
MPAPQRIPSYRLHKPSNNAVVTLSGQDVWLGRWNTPESRAKYNRVVAEWLAAGRQLPVSPDDLTIVELIARFWTHAEKFYRRKDGTPTGEADNFKSALKPLKELYGDTLAKDFGPRAYRALQAAMIGKGWARGYINAQAQRVRSVFRWAVEQELLPGHVYHALQAVKGLAKGRTDAKESEPVKPVAESYVQAIRPHVSAEVWAMVQFQLLTGARPGETVIMRTRDIDTAGDIWLYKPAMHKGEHHEHGREIRIGPRAQAIIKAFFKPELSAYVFSPVDAETRRRAKLHEQRTTPDSCGNGPGDNVRRKPERAPQDRYSVSSYRQAIKRGCDLAFPLPDGLARRRMQANGRKTKATRWETRAEWRARIGDEAWAKARTWRDDHRWHPHQLRHTAATKLRREFGIDVAQSILGHRLGSAITEVYAEINTAKADEVLAKIG